MGPFEHILVPVDFGESSTRAIDVATNMAEKFGARLTLMHVYMDPVAAYGYAEGIYWPIDEIVKAAQTELDGVLKKVKLACPRAEGILASGEPSRQIVDAIEKYGIDLVVIGTHGRRGLSRLVLGSVAEKVVRLSPVPVLTVRGLEAKRELGTEAPVGGKSW
jgi:nucleotide-binding universal stress UspA family protein